MNTEIILQDNLIRAAEILKNGGIVAFPTETVYGLGVIAKSEEAFKHLVEVKNRPASKPFTMMCGNLTQIARYCEIDVGARALLQAFTPGEVTFLLRPRNNVPHWVTLGMPSIGVRIPNHEVALKLIELVDEPLLVPSANISNEAPKTDCSGVCSVFAKKIDAIVDAPAGNNKPSTIVDLTVPGEIKIVREGPIGLMELEAVYQNAFCSIAIGCDHGGYKLKNAICDHLKERGFAINDFGTFSEDSCDYPQFGHLVGDAVANKDCELGIVVCTSGEGIMIAANKVKGVRCALAYDDIATGKAREHNDANVISFGAKYMNEEDVLRRVDIFLLEKFSTEKKHHRRVNQLEIC